ncbi:hypothetical protein C8Q79DRAFT_1101242 [Trametes meyenii]|nr:hypothetical protein C8Q79DRAFT_1101242 [Trametes meyenii]
MGMTISLMMWHSVRLIVEAAVCWLGATDHSGIPEEFREWFERPVRGVVRPDGIHFPLSLTIRYGFRTSTSVYIAGRPEDGVSVMRIELLFEPTTRHTTQSYNAV